MNGAELLARELRVREVGHIATLCGHGLDPIDGACHDAGIRLVDVRNEQAASYLAEMSGRLSKKVGVCAVSSGVAHVNALSGVANAQFDGSPMLLISGSGSTETIGMGHFQDMDQIALASPICKYARLVDRPERIPQMLHEAFSAALAPRPGPVHLTIPLNILTAGVDPSRVVRVPNPASENPLPGPVDADRIDEVAEILARSERPLLVAGSGLYYAGGEDALADLARTFAIPIVVPIWDRGSVPRPHEAFMGVIGAATGGPRLLADADLILMAGAACDYRVGYLQPPAIREEARIVRFDADPVRLQQGAGAHVAVGGDPAVGMARLAQACRDRAIAPKQAWLRTAVERRDGYRRQFLESRPAGDGLHALDIIQGVKSVLTEETIVLIDGGNIGQWAHQVLCDRYPGHWLTCGASGVIGWGIPGAMAARILYPDRPILLISGDGSFTFTVAELETAARQRLGFVALVADDQAWGIVLEGHRGKYGHGITSELGPIRFDRMAESFGAHGLRIEGPREIVPAIRKGLAADRPTVVHVPISGNQPTPR